MASGNHIDGLHSSVFRSMCLPLVLIFGFVWTLSWTAKALAASPSGTELASVKDDESEWPAGVSQSEGPYLSADGGKVVFTSGWEPVDATDTNGVADVVIRDRQAGMTELISVSSSGDVGDDHSTLVSTLSSPMSDDGRFVVFTSRSSTLVPGDTNGFEDIFLRDRSAGTTVRLPQPAPDDYPPEFLCGRDLDAAISRNGRYIVYTNRHTCEGARIFVYDRVSGQVIDEIQNDENLIDITSGYDGLDITNNGQLVLFGNRDFGGTLFNRVSRTIERIAVKSSGQPATAVEFVMTANGRYVAFTSSSGDLVSGDTNDMADVFVRDRQLDRTVRVSLGNRNRQLEEESLHPRISADGRFVGFTAYSSNVVHGIKQGPLGYVRDRSLGFTEAVTVADEGLPHPGWQTNRPIAMSGDGKLVSFAAWPDGGIELRAGRTSAISSSVPNIYVRTRRPTPQAKPVPVPRKQTIGFGCDSSSGSTGGSWCSMPTSDDDVLGANGGLAQSATDARLVSRGRMFSFDRNYTSIDERIGLLGLAWTSPFDARLNVDSETGTAIYRAEDGNEVVFAPDGAGGFHTPPAATSTLSVSPIGIYWLRGIDGRTSRFNNQGRLVALLDESGLGLSVSWSGDDLASVTNADGQTVTFQSDAAHRITRMDLPDGRYAEYSYTPAGSLETVRDLRGGVTTYRYDGFGRLDGVRDQLNHWKTRVVYDLEGRVLEKRDALDNVTTFSFDGDDETGTQTRVDPRGGVWKEVFHGGMKTQDVDPLGRVTRYYYDDQNNLLMTVDPLGRTTWTEYDDQRRQSARWTPDGGRQAWTYDPVTGQVATETDGRGNVTTYEYNANALLVKKTDAADGVTEFSYDSDFQVVAEKDPRGGIATKEYDPASKRLMTETTAGGAVTRYQYDAFGRVSVKTDPRGEATPDPNDFRTTYTYNDADQETSVTDPLGRVTTTTYDLAGRRLTVTNPRGKTTTYGYDDADRQTSVTDPNGGIKATEYDGAGNVTAEVTAKGERTTHVYDLAGRRASTVSARGNVPGGNPVEYTTTFTYDAVGNRVSEKNPAGFTTRTTYDGANRVLSTTTPGNRTTTTTYDAAGNKVDQTNPVGETTRWGYDQLNRQVSETLPSGRSTQYEYDGNGNRTTTTTNAGHVTTATFDADNREVAKVEARGNEAGADPDDYRWTYTYDPVGNRLTETDPLGATTTQTYDAANNRLSQQDANGNITRWTYSATNQVTSVTGPDAPACTTGTECVSGKKATVYGYDDVDNLVSRTDPNGNETTFVFDENNRRTEKVSPTGQRWTYAYDADGNQVTEVTARGNAAPDPGVGTITKTYDNRGLHTGTTYGDGLTPAVTLQYDSAGRLTRMTDGAGNENYTYDNADRIIRIARGQDVFTYAYDADGRITERTYPDSSYRGASFDDDGRLASLSIGDDAVTFTYDAAGNLTATALPSGLTEKRIVDRAGRTIEVQTTTESDAVVIGVAQALDPVGNPTSITTSRGATETTDTFRYDAANRLTGTCVETTAVCTTGAAKRIDWTYDPVGNRLTQRRVGLTQNGLTTYTYNQADQLTQSVRGANTTVYAYDADGNQTADGSTTYTYDLANRLRTAQVGAVAWGYTYDGVGKRLTRTRNGSIRTRLSWDPQNDLPELALERAGNRTLINRYEQGPVGPVSQTTPTGTVFYHRDPIGSIRTVTNAAGVEQWNYDYDPYGESRATVQTDPAAEANSVQYTGEALDSETTLYHLRARQYSAVSGRFSGVDPVEGSASTSHVSSYLYADGRPQVLADPSGRTPEDTRRRNVFDLLMGIDAYRFERYRSHWRIKLRIKTGDPEADLPVPVALYNKYLPWSQYNWGTDGCSGPDIPRDFGEIVRPACLQHDFCYRNTYRAYSLRGRPVISARRRYCDKRLQEEATRVCRAEVGTWSPCKRKAWMMFQGVRWGGTGSFQVSGPSPTQS